jgi:hypothetical protein
MPLLPANTFFLLSESMNDLAPSDAFFLRAHCGHNALAISNAFFLLAH